MRPNQNNEQPLNINDVIANIRSGQNPVEEVRRFLDQGGDVNAKEDGGTTLLMVVAEMRFEEAALRLLLDRGANVDAEDDFGRTALIFSAMYGSSRETCRILLDAGANVNNRNGDLIELPDDERRFFRSKKLDLGRATALHYAFRGCYEEVTNGFGRTELIPVVLHELIEEMVTNITFSRSREGADWREMIANIEKMIGNEPVSLWLNQHSTAALFSIFPQGQLRDIAIQNFNRINGKSLASDDQLSIEEYKQLIDIGYWHKQYFQSVAIEQNSENISRNAKRSEKERFIQLVMSREERYSAIQANNKIDELLSNVDGLAFSVGLGDEDTLKTLSSLNEQERYKLTTSIINSASPGILTLQLKSLVAALQNNLFQNSQERDGHEASFAAAGAGAGAGAGPGVLNSAATYNPASSADKAVSLEMLRKARIRHFLPEEVSAATSNANEDSDQPELTEQLTAGASSSSISLEEISLEDPSSESGFVAPELPTSSTGNNHTIPPSDLSRGNSAEPSSTSNSVVDSPNSSPERVVTSQQIAPNTNCCTIS